MIAVRVYKQSKAPVSTKRITTIVRYAARYERKIRGVVNIVFVSNAKIRRLNRDYRGKDQPTDVLSFAWDTKPRETTLGELYLCYPYIRAQAKRFGVPIDEEFKRMLAHGLLHLTGHDHVRKSDAAKMFKLQEKIVFQK